MITVSSRDFRRSQKRYLDQIAPGRPLYIVRRNEAFCITRVPKDDALMSKAAFYQQVETTIEDAKAGRTFAMKPGESLDDFMLRMEAAGNV